MGYRLDGSRTHVLASSMMVEKTIQATFCTTDSVQKTASAHHRSADTLKTAGGGGGARACSWQSCWYGS